MNPITISAQNAYICFNLSAAIFTVMLTAHSAGLSIFLSFFSSLVARSSSKTFAALLKAQRWNSCAKFSMTDLCCFLAVTRSAQNTRTSSKSLQSTQRLCTWNWPYSILCFAKYVTSGFIMVKWNSLSCKLKSFWHEWSYIRPCACFDREA